jgi:hypothetical protein
MLDAGDYVRCLRLGIDASLRSIKIDACDIATCSPSNFIFIYSHFCPMSLSWCYSAQ